MRDPVMTSLETLYRSAKSLGVHTEQRQHLVAAYLHSLVRRIDARLMALEEARDEVRIALVGRAAPIVFWIEECEVKKLAAPSRSAPSIKLSGKYQSVHALRGGLNNKFGVPALNNAVSSKGRLMRVG